MRIGSLVSAKNHVDASWDHKVPSSGGEMPWRLLLMHVNRSSEALTLVIGRQKEGIGVSGFEIAVATLPRCGKRVAPRTASVPGPMAARCDRGVSESVQSSRGDGGVRSAGRVATAVGVGVCVGYGASWAAGRWVARSAMLGRARRPAGAVGRRTCFAVATVRSRGKQGRCHYQRRRVLQRSCGDSDLRRCCCAD